MKSHKTIWKTLGKNEPYELVIPQKEAHKLYGTKDVRTLHKLVEQGEIPGRKINGRYLYYKDWPDFYNSPEPYSLDNTGTKKLDYTNEMACRILNITQKTLLKWEKEGRIVRRKRGTWVLPCRAGKRASIGSGQGRKLTYKPDTNGLYDLINDMVAGEIGSIVVNTNDQPDFQYVYRLAAEMCIEVIRAAELKSYKRTQTQRKRYIQTATQTWGGMLYSKQLNTILYYAGDQIEEIEPDKDTNVFTLPKKIRKDGSYSYTNTNEYKAGELILLTTKGKEKGKPLASAIDGNEFNLRADNWQWVRKADKRAVNNKGRLKGGYIKETKNERKGLNNFLRYH